MCIFKDSISMFLFISKTMLYQSFRSTALTLFWTLHMVRNTAKVPNAVRSTWQFFGPQMLRSAEMLPGQPGSITELAAVMPHLIGSVLNLNDTIADLIGAIPDLPHGITDLISVKNMSSR